MFWRTARHLAVTGLVVLAFATACGSDDAIGTTKQTGKIVSITASADGSCSLKLKASKGKQAPAPRYRGDACRRAQAKASYELTDKQYLRVQFPQTFAMVRWRHLPFNRNNVPEGAECRIVISRWQGAQNISETIFADAKACSTYVYGKPYTRQEWSGWSAPS